MQAPPPAARPLAATLTLAVALAAGVYAITPNPGFFSPRYGIVEFVDGTAHNPFARRALPAWVAHGAAAAVPEPLADRLDAQVEPRLAAHAGGRPGGWGTPLVVAVATQLAALVGFFAVVERTAAATLSPWGARGFTVGVAALLPVFSNFSLFLYDPAVLLGWAAVALALTRPYAPAFEGLVAALALTKETTLALPLAAWGHAPDGRRGFTAAARLAAVAVAQGALVLLYRDRLGEVAEWHLAENLAKAAVPANWFVFEPFGETILFRGGLPLARPVGFNLLVWVPFGTLVALGWRTTPARVRFALAAGAALLLPLQAVWGVFNEIRALYELLPLALVAAAHGVRRLAGLRTP